jgi:hypothetical protein
MLNFMENESLNANQVSDPSLKNVAPPSVIAPHHLIPHVDLQFESLEMLDDDEIEFSLMEVDGELELADETYWDGMECREDISVDVVVPQHIHSSDSSSSTPSPNHPSTPTLSPSTPLPFSTLTDRLKAMNV